MSRRKGYLITLMAGLPREKDFLVTDMPRRKSGLPT